MSFPLMKSLPLVSSAGATTRAYFPLLPIGLSVRALVFRYLAASGGDVFSVSFALFSQLPTADSDSFFLTGEQLIVSAGSPPVWSLTAPGPVSPSEWYFPLNFQVDDNRRTLGIRLANAGIGNIETVSTLQPIDGRIRGFDSSFNLRSLLPGFRRKRRGR